MSKIIYPSASRSIIFSFSQMLKLFWFISAYSTGAIALQVVVADVFYSRLWGERAASYFGSEVGLVVGTICAFVIHEKEIWMEKMKGYYRLGSAFYFFIGVFLSGTSFICGLFGSYIFGEFHILGHRSITLSFFVLAMCLMFAFVEELLFRAYLFLYVEGVWGTSYAIIVSSSVFAVAHLFGGYQSLWIRIISAFVVGILECSVVAYYRNIWVAMGSHFIYDILVMSLLSGFARLGFPGILNVSYSPLQTFACLLTSEVLMICIFLWLAVKAGRWKPKI